ncbi:lysostaphin resistance A-like protein [Halomicrococcus sp. NG-SE-24]|uniref:CPBP family intramembrane glutamic endopeptidase n=1 Tax=Halomicrococcus sp. NG-SE-24 TaxID=3436928 RepID=UPI003D9937F5
MVGPEPSVVSERILGMASSTVQIGIALLVLRYEGVRLRDLGLSPQLLAPAMVAVGGVVLVLNGVVAGLTILGGTEVSVGVQSVPPNYSSFEIAVSGVYFYLFVGPAEELVFRGYLQNKLTALFEGGNDRTRRALGVVTAAVTFSLLHVPVIVLVGGVQLREMSGILLMLIFSGITFGTVYELTRNLYLVAFLHGIGDLWPLFVDPGSSAWPNWGVIFACYALLVLLYRQWATGTSRSPLEAT